MEKAAALPLSSPLPRPRLGVLCVPPTAPAGWMCWLTRGQPWKPGMPRGPLSWKEAACPVNASFRADPGAQWPCALSPFSTKYDPHSDGLM